MRLDHLLSKEPLANRGADVRAARIPEDSRSMHWLLGTAISLSDIASTSPCVGEVSFTYGGVEREAFREEIVGRAHCSALEVRASEHLENCIASASIQ